MESVVKSCTANNIGIMIRYLIEREDQDWREMESFSEVVENIKNENRFILASNTEVSHIF